MFRNDFLTCINQFLFHFKTPQSSPCFSHVDHSELNDNISLQLLCHKYADPKCWTENLPARLNSSFLRVRREAYASPFYNVMSCSQYLVVEIPGQIPIVTQTLWQPPFPPKLGLKHLYVGGFYIPLPWHGCLAVTSH